MYNGVLDDQMKQAMKYCVMRSKTGFSP